MSEAVNHPAHDGGDTIYETIKVLEAWLTPDQMIGFCRGNAIKYLSRAGKKNDCAEDLAKAEFYTRYEAEYRARLAQGMTGEARWAGNLSKEDGKNG
jgi:hypothetical protein